MGHWSLRFRTWLEQSLQHRIAFHAFALAFSLALLLWLLTYALVFRTSHGHYEELLARDAELVGARLAQTLNEIDADLHVYADNPLMANGLLDTTGRESYLTPFLRQFRSSGLRPSNLCLTDYRGQSVACQRTPYDPPYAPDWTSRVVEELTAEARIIKHPDGDELILAVPIIHPQTDKAEGMLAIRYPLSALIAASTSIDWRQPLRLIDANTPPTPESWLEQLVHGSTYKRAPLLLGAPYQRLHLAVELRRSEEQWGEAARTLTIGFFAGGILLAVLVAIIARQMARRLTVRLRRLAQRAERGSRGEPVDFSIAPHEGDEIGRLGEAYSTLIERLRDANNRLEAKVSERTRELRRANRRLEESRARLGFALEANQEGVWDWDLKSGVVHFSRRWKEMLGYEEDEVGHRFADWEALIHPEDRASALVAITLPEHQAAPFFECEFRMQAKSGSYRWIRCRGKVVARDREGLASRVVGTHYDFSVEREAKDALQLAQLVVDNLHEAVLITDSENRIVSANPAFETITGYAAAEIVGQDPSFLQSGLHASDFFRALWTELRRTGRWSGEIWNRRKDGEFFAAQMAIIAICDSHGRTERHIAVMRDVTQAKEQEAAILHQANHDALTGLPNRRLSADRLEHALLLAQRDAGRVGLLLIDLDGFKAVNDSLGHKAGDLLLIEVARRLRACVRDSDTVARLGGDEFLVVLTQIEQQIDAQRVTEKILGELARPYSIDGQEVFVSGSVGIATSPDDGSDPGEMMIYADTAMYDAKRGGKNTFRFFTPLLQHQAQLRTEIENELRRAITRGEFVLHFQPVLTLAGTRLIGAEALLRWQHREHGLLAPDAFLAVAQETGLIAQIGPWVIRDALARLAGWLPFIAKDFRLSINLSSQECQPAIFQLLAESLDRRPILGHHLRLELSEGGALDPRRDCREALRELQMRGVQIAIDDFGTGHSALTSLQGFPVDVLKIDRSFIGELDHAPEAQAMVDAILSICRSLSLDTVAEGVETPAQAAFLCAHGCRLGQGHLFSPALAADEFVRAWLTPDAAAAAIQAAARTV